MGKTWKKYFSYSVQILVKKNKWHSILDGHVIAKDGNDAFKKISKCLGNKVFERIVIEAGPSIMA